MSFQRMIVSGSTPERKSSATASRSSRSPSSSSSRSATSCLLRVLEPLEQLDRLVQPRRRAVDHFGLLLRACSGTSRTSYASMLSAASSMWSQTSSIADASRYMSSRSNGVTNVRFSRSITSRVRRSPSCSSSRMSRSAVAARRPVREQLDEQRARCRARSRTPGVKRSKNSRFCGVRRSGTAACLPDRHIRCELDSEVERAGEAGDEAVDRERQRACSSRRTASGSARRGRRSRRRRARRRAPGRERRCPASPNSSGSFSSAAAPMIGVASRKAKRAASLCDSPTSRPPPIEAPEREKPGIERERLRRADEERCRARRRCARSARRRPRRRHAAPGGAAARRRRAAAPLRIRKIAAVRSATRTPCAASARASARGCPAGIVPTTSSQPSFASASVDLAVAQRAAEALARSAPSRARRSRSSTIAVARCVATRNVRKYGSFWWMFQPSRLRQDHAVPEARDREELGDALQEPQDDRLRVRDQRGEDHVARCALRPGAEPGEGEAGEPDEERRDPVLDVVVARPGLRALGRSSGSDFAGSAQ